MALLHLVPPALDLVAHHGRLFDEQHALGRSESSDFSAPATAEKNSHPGKTLTPPAAAISMAISSSSLRRRNINALPDSGAHAPRPAGAR
jgi:hypothetical protein